MQSSPRGIFALVLASQLVACDDATPEAALDAPVDDRAQVNNTPVLNSARLNGQALNGFTLNGSSYNGFTLNGFTLNGVDLDGVELEGTEFVGYRDDAGGTVEVRGTDLIGTQMRLMYEGHMYILSFDDIYPNPADPSGDVFFYDITVNDVDAETVGPLCELDGVATPTIPLQYAWDLESGDRLNNPNVVTFACHGAVLAKCVEWGYHPWATGTRCDSQGQNCGQVSLQDYHQACTRMARADYCGDGTAHTQNGTLVDIYDPLTPHIQTRMTASHPEWGVEAEWGPDGAVCIGTSLRTQLLDDLSIPYDPPPCLDDLDDYPDCGEFPDSRSDSRTGNSYCGAYGTDPQACE